MVPHTPFNFLGHSQPDASLWPAPVQFFPAGFNDPWLMGNSVPVIPQVDLNNIDFAAAANQGQNQAQQEVQVVQHGVAANNGKAPFYCLCDTEMRKPFTRIDSLKRHIKGKTGQGRTIACPLCDKHDGAKGLFRREHLKQHLERYHRVGKKGLDLFGH